ncbi:MAG TPA: TRAP transporter substrate-binding protein [Vitreimonas sp.]|uniref:TRAP transporter substrate-binding protein n=1 Tax=Vitreimonas sp. TaxID=3069702 RepID=UPI002D42B991|nr:TRAP transporter substrate-binding protein [Vitreimonas sp.]HYD87748.1 TRAP transporter substrate-binding protein [Vitreimonas sp.]
MISRRALLGTGAVAATGAGLAFAQAASRQVITAVDVHPSDYPTVEAVRWMGQEIERETDGRISFRIYPSGQLGTETDTVNLARFGVLDIARVYLGAVNNAFPATQPLALPYTFRDDAHLRGVIDGPIGQAILRTFEQRDLIGLAFYDSGFRSMYNARRPIHTPADMRGLKVRVPRADIFMQMLDAMGANATPIPFGEVFTGLQTHLIDAAENNWATFQSTRQYEVARYWSQTDHCCAPEALLISKARFDSFSSADRELILAKARESVPVMRGLWDQKQAAARQTVLDAGVAANDVDKDAFRRAVEPMRRRYLADVSIAETVRRIEEHG